MISFTEKRFLRKPAASPQSAPPAMPAMPMRGRRRTPGVPASVRPTQVAADAPARIWPSAPMFQYFPLNATMRPAPASMMGRERDTVSPSP